MIPPPLSTSDRQSIRAAMRRDLRALFLRVAAAARLPDERLAGDFPALVAEVEAGFRREEQAMEALALPCLHELRKDNARVLCALHRAAPAVERGDLALGRDLLAALGDLLDRHSL